LHGKLEVTDQGIELNQADEAVFYLVAATNFINYHDISANPTAICQKIVQGLNSQSYDALSKQHILDYQKYYQRLHIDLGKDNTSLPTDQRIRAFSPTKDPALLALYLQYGRYLMLASSRENSKQPANLQGIWNNLLTPPWGSKYTSNINLQMNYWPAEALNLSESTAPLFHAIQELSERGKSLLKHITAWMVGYCTIILICGGEQHPSMRPIMAFGYRVVPGFVCIYGSIICLPRTRNF